MSVSPGVEKGYALDFLSVVRHVATRLDRAADALSIADLASGYHHVIGSDLSRVKHHHGFAYDQQAIEFLIARAVEALDSQVTADPDGRLRVPPVPD